MRRTFAATAVALSLAASVLSAGTASADEGTFRIDPPAAERLPEPAAPTAQQALDRAAAALEGRETTDANRPEATLALRDLYVALPRLTGQDRQRAEALLARPTQGAADPYGDGYTVKATKKCNKLLCVHRVGSTADRATAKWATRTLKTMNRVWKKEVGSLGYRRPVKDGRRGGNGKFDVYLADVGADGLYGYCAPEFTKPGYKRLASGFCVLDNDFAKSQFGARPVNSLKVTAAHEFFHAIQFAYDYQEDPWLMEATATWMEERYADGVNDNRQYLAHGQLRAPFVPLDLFDGTGFTQYGNWVFFEYLSTRFGNGVVNRIWKQAGHYRGDGKKYSTQAIKRALPRKSPFTKVYAQFMAANTTPNRSYPEGRHWPSPLLAGQGSLGKNEKTQGSIRIDHLAAAHSRVTPKKSLSKKRWKLRVTIDGPPRRTAPAAAVVWQKKSGAVERRLVRLNKQGKGRTVVPFNRRQTKRVFVVLANASTRFDCRGAYDVGYSCGGSARDDGRRFTLTMRVFAGR
jgi:hypothetical protein